MHHALHLFPDLTGAPGAAPIRLRGIGARVVKGGIVRAGDVARKSAARP